MGRGWQATVRVERKKFTAAPADRAWSLLSSPLGWSARPRPSMAFDPDWSALPASDSARMWFFLAAAGGKPVAGVLQADAVVPAELLRVGPPGGEAAWEPRRMGK